MRKDAKIFVTDHESPLGRALVRRLKKDGFKDLLLKTHSELDLLDQPSVFIFFQKESPDYVFLTQARAGGIRANIDNPAEFLYDNLQAQTNVIHSSWRYKVRKLLFVGASCVYPKSCPQPMKEEYMLTGPLEPTSEPSAIAKIAGMRLCQYYDRQYNTNFISIIPATIFGPEDNFDIESSHVIPALIRRFHEAKVEGKTSVIIWGSGDARREFIYVDDMADASLYLMQRYNGPEVINVGTGVDISIRELASLIKNIVGFKGNLEFDTTKPEGTMRKLLDVTRLSLLGWKAKMDIESSLRNTYQHYVQSLEGPTKAYLKHPIS